MVWLNNATGNYYRKSKSKEGVFRKLENNHATVQKFQQYTGGSPCFLRKRACLFDEWVFDIVMSLILLVTLLRLHRALCRNIV